MMNLAVWSVDAQDGEVTLHQPVPHRVKRSHIDLEKHLEDWIANDSTLIAQGLTLVGRQVSIDDGRLDLLAIDSQDRWVVIEIKPGLLDSDALAQALYYAASIAHLGGVELSEKLKPRLGELGDAEALSARIEGQLAGEDGEGDREIAVMLVGVGIHPGLARMNEFLSRFCVPISVVSFEVFELNGGLQLLIRPEVVEKPTEARRPPRRHTVDAIRRTAVEIGVVAEFDRFVAMSEEAGLAVQPQLASVRIAPPTDRRWLLLYATPQRGESGGGLGIWAAPKTFAAFFPRITEEEATDALGRYKDGGFVTGRQLDERLDQIERFLTETVQRPDDNGA